MEEGFKGMNWVLHTHLPQALARNWPCFVAMAGWLHRAAGDSSHYPIYIVLTPRLAEMLLRRKEEISSLLAEWSIDCNGFRPQRRGSGGEGTLFSSAPG